MKCLTNCRHFLLPIASPLKGKKKHRPGEHDQKTHTPEAYRGQGVVPEKAGPQPYMSERVRELVDVDSETNVQARKDWKNLSHSERMKLADPDAMDRGMADNLRRYREEVEIPHKLKGQKLTTETYDQVAANTQARIDSLQSALTPVTEAQLREYADTHMRKAVEQGLKDKSLKMDAGQLDDMMAKNVDKLAHQEIEARKRQLGDHGIRHVVGNIRAVDTMLDDPDLPPTTGLQRMMAIQTMVDHDMGYTVGVVAGSFEATEYHPQYSEKYAKAQGYEKLFGKGNTKEMARMVREHAGTDLDWDKDTLMSAVRTADNTALFNREKLPALFYDVPGATDELYRLQLAQVGGTSKETTPIVKENLRKLVGDSGIDDRHKAELLLAVDEVSPYTGKFSLGMASGEIEGYDYKKDGLMHIKVKGKPERELLTGLFDLGDRQFDKFAEAYDTTGNPSVGGLDFSKGGKKVLHIDYEEPTRKATGTLATMYDDSVRPDIRLASRQAGPTSTLTDRERAWPMIQANVKGKLTAGEMAEFESRFKAGTLDEMPLTERERSYLTKLKEMLKHQAGRHDQKAHTPKLYIPSGPSIKHAGQPSFDTSMDGDSKSRDFINNTEMDIIEEYGSNDLTEYRVDGFVEAGLDEGDAYTMIEFWDWTSNDTEPSSLGLQAAAADEFGVELTEWQKGKIAKGPEEFNRPGFTGHYEHHRKEGRKFLRKSYDDTQRKLAEAGVKRVTLYRGYQGEDVAGADVGDVHWLKPNALSSWSSDPKIAKHFSDVKSSEAPGEHGVIYKMEVPASRVIGTSFTGLGTQGIEEYVLLGRPEDTPEDYMDAGTVVRVHGG
jgi:hypothetical protein